MKIEGRRSDGILLVNIGAGQRVLLDPKGRRHTRPLDVEDCDRYGPWVDADHSPEARRECQQVLSRSRLVETKSLSQVRQTSSQERHEQAVHLDAMAAASHESAAMAHADAAEAHAKAASTEAKQEKRDWKATEKTGEAAAKTDGATKIKDAPAAAEASKKAEEHAKAGKSEKAAEDHLKAMSAHRAAAFYLRSRIALHLDDDLSYDEKQRKVEAALRDKIGMGGGSGISYAPAGGGSLWIRAMTDSYVIYTVGEDTYKRAYTVLPSGAFEFPGDAVEVTQEWVPESAEEEARENAAGEP